MKVSYLLKNIIKKIAKRVNILSVMLAWYRKKRYNYAYSFTWNYKNNAWGSQESRSGTGSELKNTKDLIEKLQKLFHEKNIQSVLDIPCGDFNWMRFVDLSHIKYIGADIVKPLIKENNRKYGAANIRFKKIDIISDPIPANMDLILVRDCFIHLSYAHIFKALDNIKNSGGKYLLTSTYVHHHDNIDIDTGWFRILNLQDSPFLFPPPRAYT